MLDAKTISRWGSALGPEPVKQFDKRMVKIAQTHNVVGGRYDSDYQYTLRYRFKLAGRSPLC
jgi:hypothetical protein